MRVTVVGAAGRLGRAVVAEAAGRGYSVTGVARSAESMKQIDGLTAFVIGDARDERVVGQAIESADAVICTVAGGARTDPHQARDAAATVTAAMSRSGVSRLLVTSAYPIVARRPILAMAVLRRVLATPYADTAAADSIVAASGLDWTIVRLNRLTDQRSVGPVHVAEGALDRATGLTRLDAAALLVDLAETTRYAGRAVNVRGRDGRDAVTMATTA